MKDSELLKLAKAKIKSTEEWYICVAIRTVADDAVQATDLCNWIHSMLCGEVTYGAWADRYRTEVKSEYYRANRLKWLDWMIEYCEKEENKK